MYYFSELNQAFYEHDRKDLPIDVVEVDDMLYRELLQQLCTGCYIDKKLKIFEPRPSAYHIFKKGKWVDSRTAEEINQQAIVAYTTAIQIRLDDFARTRGYDNILSAATYATSTVAKFAAEGQAAVNARDSTWAACYAVLAAVHAGERDMPTLEHLIAELPVLAWPEEVL